MKKASFGPQGEITEVEFSEAQQDVGALLLEHEKEIEQLLAMLPEDVKEKIIRQRQEQLTYASS